MYGLHEQLTVIIGQDSAFVYMPMACTYRFGHTPDFFTLFVKSEIHSMNEHGKEE